MPRRVMVLLYLVYPVFMSAVYVLFATPAIGVITAFFSVFVISLSYEATWKKRFAAASSITSIGLILFYAIAIILGVHFDSAFTPIPTERTLTSLFLSEVILFPSLLFMVILLLQNFKNMRKNVIVLPIFWVSVFAVPLVSAVAVSIVAFTEGLLLFEKIIILCIFAGINILVFYLHDKLSEMYESKLQAELHEQEKNYYYMQCRLMQESIEKMRSIRHDMLTHLTAVKGYAAEIKAHKIISYLDELLEGGSETETYSDTGNITIDSIINYKLRNARQENIILDIRLNARYEMNIEQSDLATILGNLLDNALDAVAKVKEKKLHLGIEYSRKTLFIKVKNTFDGSVSCAPQSSEKRINTRKGGEGHGQGMKNIERAIEKYDGQMDIKYDASTFTARVFLYEKTAINR